MPKEKVCENKYVWDIQNFNTSKQCHFMHHKSCMNCSGTEPGICSEMLQFSHLSYRMAMNMNNAPEKNIWTTHGISGKQPVKTWTEFN
jgi:hypothetical protein